MPTLKLTTFTNSPGQYKNSTVSPNRESTFISYERRPRPFVSLLLKSKILVEGTPDTLESRLLVTPPFRTRVTPSDNLPTTNQTVTRRSN